MFIVISIENLWEKEYKMTWREILLIWYSGIRGSMTMVVAIAPLDDGSYLYARFVTIPALATYFQVFLQGLSFQAVYEALAV